MTNSLIQALVFVIEVFASLFIILLLLRFLMPWLGVNFHNPLAQGILKITSPLVVPARRLLPPLGRVDTATLTVAWLLHCLMDWVIASLQGFPTPVAALLVGAAFGLLSLTLMIFLYAILISVILSWVAPNNYNPAVGMITAIADPALRPFRRLIPPLGGFDVSPIFAMVGLVVLRILLGGVQIEVMKLLS